MTTVYLAPTFGVGWQGFTNGGLPLNAGLIYTYIAGGTTPQATYTTSAGSVQNANPIVLAADGRPPSEIWLIAGVSYRFDLKDSLGNLIKTYDNLSGINDPTGAQTEWIIGPTPTFVSATQFTLVGDQTTNFHVGRRVKATVTAGTSYGTITASAFGASTAITVDTTGSNPIDSGLAAVSYGLLSAANFAQSIGLDAVTRQSANIASAATTNLNAAGGDYVHITGVTGITAITLAQGHERNVVFDGILTLTNGASLVLPGAANITTAAGDTATFKGEAAGVVRCISFIRASGGIISAATQSDQQTGTSLTLPVTPGRQQFHASAAKVWCRFSAGGTIDASYNTSSITHNGTGDWTVNYTNAFSTTSYPAIATAGNGSGTDYFTETNYNAVPTASACRVLVASGGRVATDVNYVSFVAFGVQP